MPIESSVPEGRYVFVSYAHEDKAVVYPELARIRSLGVQVWYDQGIEVGREWPEEIAAALAGAAAVIVMVTPRAVASRNVRNEVNLAVARGITVLAVHLAQTTLPPGLELQLGPIQAVLAWQMDSQSYATRLARMVAAYSDGPEDALVAGGPAAPAATLVAPGPAVAGVSAAAGVAVPARLPQGPRWFSGRDAEQGVLDRALDSVPDGDGGPGGAVVAAVTGTAGAGKTTLALHWAHRAAPRFPDGQLYVNLRGYDPAGPASTAEVAAGFLDALGVPAGQIPHSDEALAALYRRMLAGRRILIVLDNAASPAQVRPLLPPGPAAMVLVTSRSAMTGLAAANGAVLVPLGLLDQDESRDLLAARLGAERLAAEPDAAGQIAIACAGLPLALAVTSARAAARPGWTLAAIADQLAAAEDADQDLGGALDVLDTGEEATSVRAVFSWSVRQLSEPAAQMFRLLGLHPGPDIGVAAAASLAGTPTRPARQLLAELTAASLVTEQPPGRYFFHDLLRAYAAEQAEEIEMEDDRDAAARRVLDYYVHQSYQAGKLIWPVVTRYLREPPVEPEGGLVRPISTQNAALAWYRAEGQVLPQVLAWAARMRLDSQAIQLRICLEPYDGLHGNPAMEEAALAAARRLGDHTAIALGNYALGRHAALLGKLDEAALLYQRALEAAELAGDLNWQAMIHRGLAGIADRERRAADATDHARRAFELARAAGAREAEFQSALGYLESRAGDTTRGLADCREALARLRAEADPIALSVGLGLLGSSCLIAGLAGEAIEHLREAAGMLHQLDAASLEAATLKELGDAYAASGDVDAARGAWQQALDVNNQLATADADDVSELRAKLGLADPGP